MTNKISPGHLQIWLKAKLLLTGSVVKDQKARYKLVIKHKRKNNKLQRPEHYHPLAVLVIHSARSAW